MAADEAPGLRRERWRLPRLGSDSIRARGRRCATKRTRAHGRARGAAARVPWQRHRRRADGACKGNAQTAGVAGFVNCANLGGAAGAAAGAAPGLVICNPPYDERLGAGEELKATYREFGDALRRGFRGWRAACIAQRRATWPTPPACAPSESTRSSTARSNAACYCMRPGRGAAQREPHEAKPLSRRRADGAQPAAEEPEDTSSLARARTASPAIACMTPTFPSMPRPSTCTKRRRSRRSCTCRNTRRRRRSRPSRRRAPVRENAARRWRGVRAAARAGRGQEPRARQGRQQVRTHGRARRVRRGREGGVRCWST